MSAVLLPCQGGWCESREKCANYHFGATEILGQPADRLCLKGRDGVSDWHLVMPLSHFERSPTSKSKIGVSE